MLLGFLGGAAQFGAQEIQRSLIQDALKERDERLAEIAKEAQERGFAHSEKITDKQIAASRQEGTEGRTLQRELATQSDTRIREEGAATRTLQREEGAATRQSQAELARLHESSASARHAQSIGMQKMNLEQTLKIAEMNRPLQQDAEGHFFKMGEKGPQYMFDEKGKKLKGPKDLSAREKATVEAILTQMKTTSTDMTMDDNARKSAMNAYQESLNRILFGASKTEMPALPIPAGAIEALRADPNLAKAFWEKYRVDPNKYLKQLPGDKILPSPPSSPTVPKDEEEDYRNRLNF